MIEGDLIHYWFPVYDTTYSYGSPGTILFLEIAKQAVDHGVKSIDFGYGEFTVQVQGHQRRDRDELRYGRLQPDSIGCLSRGRLHCEPAEEALDQGTDQADLARLYAKLRRTSLPKLAASLREIDNERYASTCSALRCMLESTGDTHTDITR